MAPNSEQPTDVVMEPTTRNVDIKIPEAVRKSLVEGSEKLLHTFFSGRSASEQPNLLVVLQRSGPLAFQVLKALAAKQNLALPPAIKTPIGRELAVRFVNQQIALGREKGVDILDDGPYSLDEHATEYRKWLEQDQHVRNLAYDIRTACQTKLPSVGQRVLVVDDTEYSGNTLKRTAPGVINLALPNTHIEVTAITDDNNWLSQIVRATFGTGLNIGEENFLLELAKGFIELYPHETKTGQTLQAITSLEDLKLLGSLIKEEKGEDPFPSLYAKYGESLLTVYPQLLQALSGLV